MPTMGKALSADVSDGRGDAGSRTFPTFAGRVDCFPFTILSLLHAHPVRFVLPSPHD
jgi:hypothetical protein